MRISRNHSWVKLVAERRDRSRKEGIVLRIRDTRPLALATVLALAISGNALAQVRTRTADYDVLPSGTVLKVALDKPLTSAEARVGDRFTGTVRPAEDHSGLPEGTRVEGVVRAAKPASKDQAGVLDVDFTGLRYPDGRSQAILGSLTSLDSKSVKRTDSGRLVSRRNSKSDRMKFLGYGAGAGALIGVLTGGNLLKGALLGAAGGYLYGELNKNKGNDSYHDVNLKEGTEFGVRLDQRVAVVPVQYGRVNGYGEPVGQRSGQVRNDRYRENPSTVNPGGGIGVMLDDREVRFGAARPLRQGQALMVPLAPVLQSAGVPYRYDRATRQVTVDGPAGRARVTLGSWVALGNGQRVRLSAPARLIQGTLYVPQQFLELATGRRAQWDEESQTLLFAPRGGDSESDRDRGL